MYAPAVVDAKIAERFKLGQYDASLLTDIKAQGTVRYLYILAVLKEGEPCYFVSSEVNAMAADLGGGSHFLCAFVGNTHQNFGCDNKWADLNTFKQKALEMAKAHLKVK